MSIEYRVIKVGKSNKDRLKAMKSRTDRNHPLKKKTPILKDWTQGKVCPPCEVMIKWNRSD